MNKLALKIEVILFLIIICLPQVGHYFGWDLNQKLVENRNLAQAPKISDLANFFTNLKLYYNDNFGFRPELVSLDRNIQINLFKTAPQSSGVTIGKDNWLFYTADIVDNLNGDPFSNSDLSQIRTNLDQIQSFFSQKGIHFYFMVAPNGQTIYPEYLPDSFKKARVDSRLDQLTNYLAQNDPNFNFINPTQNLKKAKPLGQLYYKTDTHWNELGAFIAYFSLMSKIKQNFPNLKVEQLSDFNISMKPSPRDDLEILLGSQGHYQDIDPVLTPKSPNLAKQLTPDCPDPYIKCAEVIQIIGNPELPKLVSYRDSFSTALIPYLSESFQRSHYIWQVTPFSIKVVKDDSPDIVIYELTERELWRLPQRIFDFML